MSVLVRCEHLAFGRDYAAGNKPLVGVMLLPQPADFFTTASAQE